MKVRRHKLSRMIMALSLVCALFLGFFFIQAVLSPDAVEKKVLIGEYTQVGRLDYSAKLKPNLIYGKDEINRNEVLYSALLSEMEVIYSYSLSPPPEKLNGNYKITILLSPAKGGWEKELRVYKGEISQSSFDVSIPIDWNLIVAMWKEIENETKYDFGDPNVKLIVGISINCSLFGSNIEERFLQTSNITYGKVISFSEADKSKRDAVYYKISSVNTMSVLGFPIEVRGAKLIFGVPFLAFASLFGALCVVERGELANSLSNRKKKSFEKKFRNRIVDILEFPECSKTFRVLSLKDLAKLSYELEKPILKVKGTFAVVDGDKVYVYDDYNNIIGRKK
ncbi:MAG: DUF5305 family protein [Archaeoglobaceae archaeon]